MSSRGIRVNYTKRVSSFELPRPLAGGDGPCPYLSPSPSTRHAPTPVPAPVPTPTPIHIPSPIPIPIPIPILIPIPIPIPSLSLSLSPPTLPLLPPAQPRHPPQPYMHRDTSGQGPERRAFPIDLSCCGVRHIQKPNQVLGQRLVQPRQLIGGEQVCVPHIHIRARHRRGLLLMGG